METLSKIAGNPLSCQVVTDQQLAVQITQELEVLQKRKQNKRPASVVLVRRCEICAKVFSTTSLLKRHMVVHTKEKKHECGHCGKRFSQVVHLKRHMSIHTGENVYCCSVCQRRFMERSRYEDHMLAHLQENPYPCELCEKGFKHRVGLKRHMKTHSSKRDFQCEICEKTFVEKQTLRVHERKHFGTHPYKCSYCEKGFNRQKLLEIHLRRHDKSRPFQCEICQQGFASKQGLLGHTQIHSRNKDIKPFVSIPGPPSSLGTVSDCVTEAGRFQCEFCTRTFDRKCSLSIHQKALHHSVADSNVVIVCGVCTETFSSLEEVHAHIQIHHAGSKNTEPASTQPASVDRTGQTVSQFPDACSTSNKDEVKSGSDQLLDSVLYHQSTQPTIDNSQEMVYTSSETASDNFPQLAYTPVTTMSGAASSASYTTYSSPLNNTAGETGTSGEVVANILNLAPDTSCHGQGKSLSVERSMSENPFSGNVHLAHSITLQEDHTMAVDISDWSDLSKCPALSGRSNINWDTQYLHGGGAGTASTKALTQHETTEDPCWESSTSIRTPMTLEAPGDTGDLHPHSPTPPVKRVCPGEHVHNVSKSSPKTDSKSSNWAECQRAPDRTHSFIASDLLKELLPSRRKRRRSI